ncbi:hypothetical protein AB1Y20_005155 [Prymnesium parvum]|uniref:Uncharacterized protein n=1 Tax=Prymnesium parvum TaxID=97485 RepID=A0AB34J4L8_PRYPA
MSRATYSFRFYSSEPLRRPLVLRPPVHFMALTKLLVSTLLAFIAGYVDVICVIRFKAFPATQTGNVVYIGFSLHHLWYGHMHRNVPLAPGEEAVEIEALIYRVMVVFCSFLGAYAYCALEHWQARRAQRSYDCGNLCSTSPQATASTAAPLIAFIILLSDAIPWMYGLLCTRENYEEALEAGKWSVCLLAFAFGAVHYLCGPTSDGSRLKAVTFAATGHLHKLAKLSWRCSTGLSLKPSERDGALQSIFIVLAMTCGALVGGVAIHLSPFDDDRGLMIPVSLIVLLVLELHDRVVEPPGGWQPPEKLSEPLLPAQTAAPNPETAAAPTPDPINKV